MADTKVTIKNTDLFLVNRLDKSYKIEGSLFKKEFGSFFVDDRTPPDINEVIVSDSGGNSPLLRFEDQSFDVLTLMNEVGDPLADYSVKANVSGAVYNASLISDKIIKVESNGVEVCETELIENVTVAANPTSYDLRVDIRNAITNNTRILEWGDTLISANEVTGVVYGSSPAGAGEGSAFYYKFDVACTPAFIRSVGAYTDSPTKLYSSNDGITWTLDKEFTDLAGPGDTTVSGTHTAIYWAWLFSPNVVADMFTAANYYPSGVVDTVTLTFPSDQGFDCFEQGDEVQLAKGDVITTVDIYSGPTEPTGKSLKVGDTFTMGVGTLAGSKALGSSTSIGTTAANGTWVYDFKALLAEGTQMIAIGSHGVGYGFAYSIDGANWTAFEENVIFNDGLPVATLPVPARYIVFYTWSVGHNGMTEAAYIKETSLQTYKNISIISKTDKEPWQIVVNGGNWSDGNDIVGDILPYTDKGFYFDDPDINPLYADPQPIFDPAINPNYTLIRRDHAWQQFDFLTPINVTSAVHFQGGAHFAGDSRGSYNFRVFINGIRIDNTDPESILWFSSARYETIQVIPFTGQMTSLRIESVDEGDPDEIHVVRMFGGGVGASNIFVDGETEAHKVTGTVVTTEPGQRQLIKETPYDTKLTVDGPKDLDDPDFITTAVMTDGSDEPGPYAQTPYKLVTTDIESVAVNTTATTYFAKADDTNNNYDGSYAWTTADGAEAEYDVGVYVTHTGYTSHETLHFYTPGSGHTVRLDYSGSFIYQVYVSETGTPGSYTLLGEFTVDELAANKAVSPYQYSYITNGKINGVGGYWGVSGLFIATVLTFPDSVSTNPDLQYFRPGDVVQSDSQWDQRKIWSQTGVVSGNAYGDWNNVFQRPIPPNDDDGDLYPGAGAHSGTSGKWTFNVGETLSGSIEIFASSGTTTGQTGGIINLKNSSDQLLHKVPTDSHSTQPIWLGPFEVDDLKTIEITNEGTNTYRSTILRNIKLNGKWLVDDGIPNPLETLVKVVSTDLVNNTMTVDGGEWAGSFPPDGENRDQIWSEEGTWTGNPQNKEGVFNGVAGDTTTSDNHTYTNNSEFIYTFNPSITGLQSVEFEMYTWGSSVGRDKHSYQYNNNGWQTTSPNSEAANLFVIHSHNVTSLESFGYKVTANSNGGISRVWVTDADGNKKLLVDKFGDTHVEYQTNGGQGSIFKISGTDIYLNDTGDRDNRWIAENKATTDFFVSPDAVVQKDGATLNCVLINSGTNNDLLVDKLVPESTNVAFKGIGDVGDSVFKIRFKDSYMGIPTDTLLKERAELCVTMKAENIAGEDIATGCFIPELNLSGKSGPIIDSEGYRNDTVEVLDIEGLVDPIASVGDPVIMTDLDGNPAEYTLVTTDIESVSKYKLDRYKERYLVRGTPNKGTYENPRFTWDQGTDVNNGDFITVGDRPPGTQQADLIMIKCETRTQGIFRHHSQGLAGEYQAAWVSDDGVNWTWEKHISPGGTTDILTTNGKGYYLAYARQGNYDYNGSDNILDYGIGAINNFYLSTVVEQTMLTFPDSVSTNPDLKYFQPGDVVGMGGGDYYVASTTNVDPTADFTSPANPSNTAIFANALDGTTTSNFYVDFPVGGYEIDVDFKDAIVITSNLVQIYHASLNVIHLKFSDGTEFECLTGGSSTSLFSYTLDPEFVGKPLVGFRLTHRSTSHHNPWLSYIKINNVVLNLKVGQPVKVVSTGYPDSNTMIVDGGKWSTGASYDMGGGTCVVKDLNGDIIDGSGRYGTSTDTNVILNGLLDTANTCDFYQASLTLTMECTPTNAVPAGGTVTMFHTLGTGQLTVDSNYKPTLTHINGAAITPIPFTSPVLAGDESPGNAKANVTFPSTANTFTITFERGGADITVSGFAVDTPEGDTYVTFGPVTGTGKLGNTDGTTVEITDSNGRWIDWTNNNSGVEYTDTYSPQQFAVKSTAAPFLDINNPGHVELFNRIKTSITNYSNSFVDTIKYFVDKEDHQIYTEYELLEKFGKNEATDRFLELSNPHPEYDIKEIVRFKGHYRVVHDLRPEFQLIEEKIEELENQVEYTIGNVTVSTSAGNSLNPISVGNSVYVSCLHSGDAPSELLTFDWTIPAFCTKLISNDPSLLYIRVDSAGIGTIRCTVSSNDSSVTDSPQVGAAAITALN